MLRRLVERVGSGKRRGLSAEPVVSVERGRTLLRVDGVIQSIAVDDQHEPDFWDAMVPRERPASTLILGLGAGTIATLITRRFGAVPIVGIERDPRIARLAGSDFGLDRLSNVQIIVADAFTFLPKCATRFDHICVDLYVAGRLQHGVLGAEFLHSLARALTQEGTAMFNLWSGPYLGDQLRRLQRVLLVRDVITVNENVIVTCARRALVDILPC